MKQILLALFLTTTIHAPSTRHNPAKHHNILRRRFRLARYLNKIGDPSPWETPNMLTLAAEGAKFSQAYSPHPTCAPSRAALLSGRHPVKTKVTQVSGGKIPGLNAAQSANKLIGPYDPRRLGGTDGLAARICK